MLPRGVKFRAKVESPAVDGTALQVMPKFSVLPAARSVPALPEVSVTVVAFVDTVQPDGRVGALPYVKPEGMVIAIEE